MRSPHASIAALSLATLLGGPALADETPAPPPAAGAAAGKPAKTPDPAPLPPPEVRFWMAAPTPTGLWSFRIDNEGQKAVRIPADIRLLRFEIEPAPIEAAAAEASKGKPKPKDAKAAKPIVCELPASLRPDGFPDKSALLLAPGESYLESFDPRLFCFGDSSPTALRGASLVRTHFGWNAPAAKKGKPAATTPFAVEGTAFPAEVAALPGIDAPTMVLSYEKAAPEASKTPPSPTPIDPRALPKRGRPSSAGDASKPKPGAKADEPKPGAKADEPKPGSKADEPSAPPPAPAKPAVVDENAPRLELGAARFIDAGSANRAAITLTATNAGHRPMLVALHNRMLAFRVEGPDGSFRCDAMPPTHAIPRELFRTLKPGQSSSMTVLIAETCPREALRRPGLYKVTATLFANESGAELGLSAYTGAAWLKTPSLVRVLSAPEPFYASPPHALPTPKPPEPAPEESEETDSGS
jgi:hypothetical protein